MKDVEIAKAKHIIQRGRILAD